MKRIFIAVLLVSVCMGTGCLSRGGDKKAKVDAAQETTETKAHDAVITPAEDGTVELALTDGHGEATIRHEKGQTVHLVFQSGEFTSLHGKLTSEDPAANIRFAQIMMPNGTADGPFGPKIDYQLTGDGTYKLAVNENIMAGDPWEGDFTVTIDLK